MGTAFQSIYIPFLPTRVLLLALVPFIEVQSPHDVHAYNFRELGSHNMYV